MKSLNKSILLRLVGQDPELKVTPSGIPVGRFSLATNERFKDKSGKFQERTEWHNIVAWQRLAEIIGVVIFSNSWPERSHYGLLRSGPMIAVHCQIGGLTSGLITEPNCDIASSIKIRTIGELRGNS